MAYDLGFAPYDSNYAFLSLYTQDSTVFERTKQICTELNRRGLRCWYNDGTQDPENFDNTIESKIRGSRFVLMFVCEEMLSHPDDKACNTKNEFFTASLLGTKQIVPVYLGTIDSRKIHEDYSAFYTKLYDLSGVEINDSVSGENAADVILDHLLQRELITCRELDNQAVPTENGAIRTSDATTGSSGKTKLKYIIAGALVFLLSVGLVYGVGSLISPSYDPNNYSKENASYGTVHVTPPSEYVSGSDISASTDENGNAIDATTDPAGKADNVTNATTKSAKATKATRPTTKATTRKTAAKASWGAWSDWSASNPGNHDDVETKTQYRARNKSYTTDSASSLSGWTKYDSKVSYGSWSGWSDSYASSSSTLDVETQSVQTAAEYKTYRYGRYVSYNCSMGTYAHFCPTCGKNLYGGSWSYEETGELSSPAKASSFNQYCGHKGSFGTTWRYNNRTWYYEYVTNHPAQYKTQYRTRSKSTTNYFWKWGDWTNWSDSYVGGDETDTRTMYRYRDKK